MRGSPGLRAVARTDLPAPPLPPGRPLLVVTGFMGTGKTEAGGRAARLLELPFLDLDRVVAGRAGRPVREVFALEGEEGFRRREREAVREAARLSGAVVATGGGAPLDGASFGELARAGRVVVLQASPEEVERRLARVGGAGDRPLLGPDPPARIRALLEERAPAYAAAGELLDTTGLGPEEVAARLAARYPGPSGGPFRLEVAGPEGPYPVLVGPGALASLPRALSDLLPSGAPVAVVADRAVEESVGRPVAELLAAAGLEVRLRVGLPPGEEAKSASVVADLWARFARAGLDRTGAVVAVGGGAALDAAGFAAATYARGVRLVNVPTTLLAMVDASLGGKVGIDHAGVKNLVGAFHHPALVVADPLVLCTLPSRALRWGLAECVKAAVLASPLVLEVLKGWAGLLTEASSDGPPDQGRGGAPGGPPDEARGRVPGRPWLQDRLSALAWVVEQAVRVKAAYVAADPEDGELRHSLNLGHTFGHGIEGATGYAVPHGEAVAVGLLAAARLGARAGVTDPALEGRLARLLRALGLPTRPPEGLDPGRVAAAMAGDKKRRAGRLVFVVPAPGGAALLEGVPMKEALEVLFAAEPDGGGT
ncbi:MAG TPA: bifunctional shikimate kinase/3-dehydroquinate synthase [Actinomycetota bacterium]|nr:bifunctional shikimate kinase/3-dehydroquinate synthase [Actinomycetota bacterium]